MSGALRRPQITASWVAILAAFAGLASCATVSGLADYDVVDCPGGCPDVTPMVDATAPGTDSGPGVDDAQTGPPICDPAKDVDCIVLPPGFTLVARSESGDGGVAPDAGDAGAPACPTGLEAASDVGESPMATSDPCRCDTCKVTQQASCVGRVANAFDTGAGTCANAGDPTHYDNVPYGTCQNDLFTGTRSATGYIRLTLPAPSGGACTPDPPVVNQDRIAFSNRARHCANTARCSGGVCDARVPAPFRVCLAAPGDVTCPAGFGDKRIVGEKPLVECTACACTVTRAPCVGRVDHYDDANCTAGLRSVTADGTCRPGNWDSSVTYESYKVVATSVTGCTAGMSSLTAVTLDDPQTVCCR